MTKSAGGILYGTMQGQRALELPPLILTAKHTSFFYLIHAQVVDPATLLLTDLKHNLFCQ